jgi:TPR repeat protein
VLCGGAILWLVYKEKTTQRKLAEDAREYRVRAEQGNPKAQSNLASMYYYGKGVMQDHAEALRWYRKAADQGDAKAQYGLGSMYYYGTGVTQDYPEAVCWYRKAANRGDAKAQYGLGFLYYQGKGVLRDAAEAVRWYRKAADQGDADAQYALGVMYRNGQGVPQDAAEAVRWYRSAADQGDAGAKRALDLMQTGSNAGRKLRYLELSFVFLGGLWFSIDFLLPGRSFRDWRQKAKTLFGISGMLWAGWTLLSLLIPEIRYLPCFNLIQGLLGGMSLAVFICLGLTHKKSGRGQDRNNMVVQSEVLAESSHKT